jgi:hypothetical protein
MEYSRALLGHIDPKNSRHCQKQWLGGNCLVQHLKQAGNKTDPNREEPFGLQ